MASPNLLPNIVAGNQGAASLAVQNMGIQPVGNGTGTNIGAAGQTVVQQNSNPIPVSLNPAQNNLALPAGTTGTTSPTVSPVSAASSGALLPTNAGTGTTGVAGTTTASPSTANSTSSNLLAGSNTPELTSNLNNVLGSGVGSVVSSTLQNLGSSDSTYMQAYENAMANPNSEQLATLQTELGNEGISGNSSTAALSTADLLSQETSQEGLQEQQLLQSNVAEEVGLEESLIGPAQQAQENTGWSIFGNVAGEVGGAAALGLLI